MAKKSKTKTDAAIELVEIDSSEAAEKLEESMIELVFNEPFYANLLLNMRREFTTRLPTVGVSVTDEVNLHVNPFFWCSLSLIERVDILKHECHHVINNHFVRFRDLEPQIYENPKERGLAERVQDITHASLLNQAADYAINEYLPNLPKTFSVFDNDGKPMRYPETLKDGSPHPEAGKLVKAKPCLVKYLREKVKNAKHKETSEYYYELLKEEKEKNPNQDPSEGMATIDDHSVWHESDATEDQITEKVKEVVNKAVEQTDDRAKGKLPFEILQAIEALNHVPKDWRQDLQSFAARCAEIMIESTRKKRNRRYGLMYPGTKVYPRLHLVTISDMSGSVNDEEIAQFSAELKRLSNLDVDITIIEHDAKVNAQYKFNPKKPLEAHGRGGTSFKEAYERAAKVECDGIIHFTDGECWDEQIPKPKVPVLWALYGKRKEKPYTWGRVTNVEVKKRVAR